ncbi:hypothetical protein JCM10213_005340 [Rhodosporidiobolus nylandii]
MSSPPPPLPDDVLHLVAHELLEDDRTHAEHRKDALCMLRVCKGWQSVGTEWLFREVDVEGERARKLLKRVEGEPELGGLVRRFHVRGQPPRYGAKPEKAVRRLFSLCADIRCLVLHPACLSLKAVKAMVEASASQLIPSSVELSWAFEAEGINLNLTDLHSLLLCLPHLSHFSLHGDEKHVFQRYDAPPSPLLAMQDVDLSLTSLTPSTRSPIIRNTLFSMFDPTAMVSLTMCGDLADPEFLSRLSSATSLEHLSLSADGGTFLAGLPALSAILPCLQQLKTLALSSRDPLTPFLDSDILQHFLPSLPPSLLTGRIAFPFGQSADGGTLVVHISARASSAASAASRL